MIVEEKSLNGGTQVLHRFDNGYGASVIQGPYSYGGPQGQYELAVIKWRGGTFALTYETPITDDVLGYLEPDAVQGYLRQIEALTEEVVIAHNLRKALQRAVETATKTLKDLDLVFNPDK